MSKKQNRVEILEALMGSLTAATLCLSFFCVIRLYRQGELNIWLQYGIGTLSATYIAVFIFYVGHHLLGKE